MSTIPKYPTRDLTVWVILIFLAGWACFIHARSYSMNAASRLATIESLVQRGTWAIDESAFASTVDKIKVGSHFYSDKPPVLSLAGAGVYFILHRGLGLTLQSAGCVPDQAPTYCRALLEAGQADWAYFVLVLVLVSLPGALILAFVYRLARRQGFSNGGSLALTLGLGLGTALFPYSIVFSNHVPAAAATLAAFYVLFTREPPTRLRLALAGLAASLATTIDLSNGAFLGALFIYTLLRYRSGAAWFVVGSLGPVLLTAILDYQIVGNPLPPHLYPQGFDYEGSAFSATIAGNQPADNIPLYAFHLFLGDHGVLAFYPLLLWYLYATWRALRTATGTIRWMAGTVIGGSLVYVAYFVLYTDDFGGLAYSPRWLLNPVPLLALFAAVNPALYSSRWRMGLLGLLAAISAWGAFQGAIDPWQPALPSLRLEYAASYADRSLAVCLSGYDSLYDVDPNIRKSLGANHVLPRRFDARSGFVVPSGPAWWFINKTTPLASKLSQPLGLGIPGAYSLHANLKPAVRQWLSQFKTNVYDSPVFVPLAQDPLITATLPITFGNEIALLGYKREQSGSKLTMITAWRIGVHRAQPGERRIFMHLLAGDGRVAQQNDAMAADYGSLRPGDVLFQMQILPLTEILEGEYWVQVGVYNPQTGVRLEALGSSDRLLLARIKVSR